jgi:prolyl oligopeptidase
MTSAGFRLSAGLGLAVALSGCGSRAVLPQPQTERKPVTTQYHGVTVTDPYQWLEEGSNETVRAWTERQNQSTRAYFDQVRDRANIERRLRQLFDKTSANFYSIQVAATTVFALKFKPPAQQPLLVRFTSPNTAASEQTVLDPNQLDSSGATHIDWYAPSPDAKLVAVSLSKHGSEDGTLHFFDVATGNAVGETIPRVQYPTAGGSAAWNTDGSGIFYTRYPAAGERPPDDMHFYQQVYFHKLGTPVVQDTYEIGKEFPRIAEIELQTGPGGQVLASVANGDGGDFAHWLREKDGKWRQLTRFEDGVKQIEFGRDPLYIELPRDNSLYLLSRKHAPRGRILRVPLAAPDLARAEEVVRQGTNTIQTFRPSASGLYVLDLAGGPSRIRFFDFFAKPPSGQEPGPDTSTTSTNATAKAEETADEHDTAEESDTANAKDETKSDDASGAAEAKPETPAKPDYRERTLPVRGLVAVQEMLVRRGDELLFRTVSYTEPYVWNVYDPRQRDRITPTQLKGTSPAPFYDVEAERVFATSKDGTKVPMNIIRRKGTRLDGENPTLLYGYGGYGLSLTPNFDFTRRLWLDQGGVFVVANLRGGGEYGEAWHKAGSLTNKQNVFDDFIACAEWLVKSNYTRPAKLAIQGGSNGGLLMGAALTQRPDLFRAVVSHVGIYDMLRVERDPNGAFNVTEFGSVTDPAQFQALYAYSPYHRLRDKAAYPAVFLLTGEHDGRVNPSHSRKMAARLQAATQSDQPVLLHVSSQSGHGIGTALDERIAQLADVYSFLLDQLGIEYSLIDRGPWAGAVTPTTAVVKAKLAESNLLARLVVSKSPLFRQPRYFGPALSATNSYNIVTFELTGLQPDTPYHYALEVNGRLDRRLRGQFRTFLDRPASFTFAFASCGRTGSTRDTYDTIRQHKPLFYLNTGDFHYQDIGTNDVGRYREAYDRVLASPQQADLYRSTAFSYVWDDHDSGGNNVNRRGSAVRAARQAYEEFVPHYPLANPSNGAPIYHSFSVGRVKFIVTDLRSDKDDQRKKDDENKTMMGAAQKEWFKQELLAAKGKYPLICWVSSVPWIGTWSSNYYPRLTNAFGFIHHTNKAIMRERRSGRPPTYPGDEDHWSVFSTERREIADFIKSNHIQGVFILHGDAHMLAADDGSHSDYATGGGVPLPVIAAAPLDQNPSIKGGPYSQGTYYVRDRDGEGAFGLATITDTGKEIRVRFSGRNNKDEEKISLEFKVPVTREALWYGKKG